MSATTFELKISRRRFLSLAAAAGASVLLSGKAVLAADPQSGSVLILYFSRTGNTRKVAEAFRKRLGGDLVQIVPAVSYPADQGECIKAAKKEQQENARPALASALPDVSGYETVLFGFPIWHGTMPMACFTALESLRPALEGKRVVPFATHGTGNAARAEADVKRLLPKSEVLPAFAMRGDQTDKAQQAVDAWEGTAVLLKK